MKYMFTLISLVLLVCSCDKRSDIYKGSNKPAVVNLSLLNSHSPYTAVINNNVVNDNLKWGNSYSFSLNITDEQSVTDVIFEGDGLLMNNASSVSTLELANGVHTFVWSPDATGERIFKVKTVDAYDIETIYEFHISVFVNIVPNIDWTLVDVNQLDPYEKRIIVDGYDGDEIYGGSILYYQYIIDSDTTNYPGNHFNYIFPGAGFYDIGVRAMDSNNEWSNIVFISDFEIN